LVDLLNTLLAVADPAVTFNVDVHCKISVLTSSYLSSKLPALGSLHSLVTIRTVGSRGGGSCCWTLLLLLVVVVSCSWALNLCLPDFKSLRDNSIG